eukprot:2205480-Alexandrium_andersonii.AAC.1
MGGRAAGAMLAPRARAARGREGRPAPLPAGPARGRPVAWRGARPLARGRAGLLARLLAALARPGLRAAGRLAAARAGALRR